MFTHGCSTLFFLLLFYKRNLLLNIRPPKLVSSCIYLDLFDALLSRIFVALFKGISFEMWINL